MYWTLIYLKKTSLEKIKNRKNLILNHYSVRNVSTERRKMENAQNCSGNAIAENRKSEMIGISLNQSGGKFYGSRQHLTTPGTKTRHSWDEYENSKQSACHYFFNFSQEWLVLRPKNHSMGWLFPWNFPPNRLKFPVWFKFS